jgi:transcription factor IIIB 90 kDa subunit
LRRRGSGSSRELLLVQFDSHEKSLARGKTEIQLLVSQLNIRPREDMTEAAHRLYRLALQRNFTRGRRTNQVKNMHHFVVYYNCA